MFCVSEDGTKELFMSQMWDIALYRYYYALIFETKKGVEPSEALRSNRRKQRSITSFRNSSEKPVCYVEIVIEMAGHR